MTNTTIYKELTFRVQTPLLQPIDITVMKVERKPLLSIGKEG